MRLENKYLRWHYVVASLLLALFIIGFLVFKGQNKIAIEPSVLEVLKSISYLITFVAIPLAYGWFQSFMKPRPTEEEKEVLAKEENQLHRWKKRFFIFSALSFVNLILFVLTFDRSLMFVLIISLSVYLLNKPQSAS